MKVSVIMAVYNGEKYLNTSIESILNQTLKNFEFIIVDDGSEDKTPEIITGYAKKDRRIRIFRNPINIGLTKSLNRAIKISKGEFIARIDVDDIALPKRLEIQLNFLLRNPDYAFCGCNGILKQNGQKVLNYFENDEIRKNLIVKNCFSHPTIFIRKNIFERYGYYNEKYLYAQDYELWCRLIYKFRLKAKNLVDDLIIMNQPIEKLLHKNISKLVSQLRNDIKTRLIYLKYADNKIGGLISILKSLMKCVYVIILSPFTKSSFRIREFLIY